LNKKNKVFPFKSDLILNLNIYRSISKPFQLFFLE
jgi:hypothetical protein